MKQSMTIISILVIFIGTSVFAVPPNEFEPWRMYAVYESGYDVGKDILKGNYGNISLLQGCMQSDYSSWKLMGWNDVT
ncbi:MAG: hypothetical protein V3R54_07225, partial [Thermodesulfovibrionia bacterium]